MNKEKFKIIDAGSKKILLENCSLKIAQEIIDQRGWKMLSLRNGSKSEIFVVMNDC